MKSDGEACNADGTFKDASEIEWLNSPTNLVAPPLPPSTSKGPQKVVADSSRKTKKKKVSVCVALDRKKLLTLIQVYYIF